MFLSYLIFDLLNVRYDSFRVAFSESYLSFNISYKPLWIIKLS